MGHVQRTRRGARTKRCFVISVAGAQEGQPIMTSGAEKASPAHACASQGVQSSLSLPHRQCFPCHQAPSMFQHHQSFLLDSAEGGHQRDTKEGPRARDRKQNHDLEKRSRPGRDTPVCVCVCVCLCVHMVRTHACCGAWRCVEPGMPPGTMKPEQDPRHMCHMACASVCLRFAKDGPATDSMILMLPHYPAHTLTWALDPGYFTAEFLATNKVALT